MTSSQRPAGVPRPPAGRGAGLRPGDVVTWVSSALVNGQPTPVTHRGLVYRVNRDLVYVEDSSRGIKFKTAAHHLTVLRRVTIPR